MKISKAIGHFTFLGTELKDSAAKAKLQARQGNYAKAIETLGQAAKNYQTERKSILFRCGFSSAESEDLEDYKGLMAVLMKIDLLAQGVENQFRKYVEELERLHADIAAAPVAPAPVAPAPVAPAPVAPAPVAPAPVAIVIAPVEIEPAPPVAAPAAQQKHLVKKTQIFEVKQTFQEKTRALREVQFRAGAEHVQADLRKFLDYIQDISPQDQRPILRSLNALGRLLNLLCQPISGEGASTPQHRAAAIRMLEASCVALIGQPTPVLRTLGIIGLTLGATLLAAAALSPAIALVLPIATATMVLAPVLAVGSLLALTGGAGLFKSNRLYASAQTLTKRITKALSEDVDAREADLLPLVNTPQP